MGAVSGAGGVAELVAALGLVWAIGDWVILPTLYFLSGETGWERQLLAIGDEGFLRALAFVLLAFMVTSFTTIILTLRARRWRNAVPPSESYNRQAAEVPAEVRGIAGIDHAKNTR